MELQRAWRLRTSLAGALEQVVDDLEAQLAAATPDQIVDLIDSFLPGRSPSPEWSASLTRLVETLWQCLPPETIAALRDVYAERPQPVCEPLANQFSPEYGTSLRTRRWRPADARRAAMVLR